MTGYVGAQGPDVLRRFMIMLMSSCSLHGLRAVTLWREEVPCPRLVVRDP